MQIGKNGLSLPATSINLGQAFEGGGVRKIPYMGQENDLTDETCFGPNFYDAPSYNYLDMGAETLTQLGWYIMLLSTEYELFGLHGQIEDQKETLEELFLALQSIKRLDIMANCYLAKMYNERIPEAPILMCANVFTDDRPNFKALVLPTCQFLPQTDGYSGFLLREDATRDALLSLNDNSDPMYNIKLISSANSFITEPCSEKAKSQGACYLMYQQEFLSFDQIIGLLNGLVFIKKYIPENAKVTTCDGHIYDVLKTAQDITWAICNRIGEDDNRAIWLPGTNDNCTAHIVAPDFFDTGSPTSKIYLSNKEGGDVNWLFYGIAKTCKFITGKEPNITLGNEVKWNILKFSIDNYYELILPQKSGLSSNQALFVEAESIGMENGYHYYFDDFGSRVNELHKEIMPLINNTLYPLPPNAPIDQSKFLTMMCNAPCTGQCQKSPSYDAGVPNSNPPFECANTPGWLGERWDGAGFNSKVLGNENLQSRIFNGLDYMVLYNLYTLNYNTSAPFNKPDNIANPTAIGKDNTIIGSGYICLNDTKYYEIKPHYTNTNNSYDDIVWSSTVDLAINSLNTFGTIVERINQGTNSLLKVNYTENRPKTAVNRTDSKFEIIPFSNPTQYRYIPPSYEIAGYINDHCYNQSAKLISDKYPKFSIVNLSDPCYTAFQVEGDEMENFNFHWTFYNKKNGQTHYDIGDFVEITEPFYSDFFGAVMDVTISASPKNSGSCSPPDDFSTSFILKKCTGKDPKLIRVFPNPNSGIFNVELEDANMSIPAGGLNLYLINTNSGTTVGQYQMNQNSILINTNSQPPGNYKISTIIQGQPTEANFIIIQ